MRRNLPSDTDGSERRGLALREARVEVREDTESGEQRFVGHAAVFDSRTAIGNPLTWGFYEEIAPGAFTKTLQEGDARFLIDHDSYYVVARSSAGTLDLAQDKIGLRVDSALDPELSYVNDLRANLRNGNITGMSFGFYVVKDDWATEEVETNDGHTAQVEVRRILETKLIEVSAVTFPAYEDTDAGLRSIVARALRSRGDADAIARRTESFPALAELLGDATRESEPAETTQAPESVSADDVMEGEPAESTRDDLAPPIEARMRARARRWGLALPAA